MPVPLGSRFTEDQDAPASLREVGRETGPRASHASALAVGATTVAGVGLGLVAVTLGAAFIGALAEAVLVPSLLLKVAGGIAGGGLGLARGLRRSEKD